MPHKVFFHKLSKKMWPHSFHTMWNEFAYIYESNVGTFDSHRVKWMWSHLFHPIFQIAHSRKISTISKMLLHIRKLQIHIILLQTQSIQKLFCLWVHSSLWFSEFAQKMHIRQYSSNKCNAQTKYFWNFCWTSW